MRIVIIILFMASYACAVTKIANDYLKEGSLVLYGEAKQVMGIHSNAIVTFHITNVYWGQTKNSTINIVYPFIKAPKILDTKMKLVFVNPMKSSRNYRYIQEFSSTDNFANQKLESLEKLLAIEKLPRKIAEEQHFQFCIDQLKSETAWQRWNGFWEWEYIVSSRSQSISAKMLQDIILTYALIPELSLKKRMRETIISMKRILGSDLAAQTVENESVQVSIEEAISQLKEDDLQVQINALHTIGQYRNITSHDVLVQNLQHSSHHIRAICLFYLRFQGGSRDISSIIKVLQTDPSLRVRKNAIIALGKIGAVEAISEIEKYENISYTARAAKNALEQLRILAK